MSTVSTPEQAATVAAKQANDVATEAVIAAVGDPPPALAVAADEPPHVLLKAPIPARSVSLAIIAILASVYALHWAAAVVVPLLLGVMGSYALEPVVRRMVQVGLPRMVSAVLLVVGGLVGMAGTSYTLSDDAASIIESLPGAAQKLRRALSNPQTRVGGDTIDKLQKAATELERAAADGAGSTPPLARGVTKVQVERAAFNIKDYLLPGTMGLATAVGQAVVVVFVTFFLLSSGDTFRRKLVRIAGPTFAQ
ncbi:MAG: AI-2E family transporter, partial [Vitreoscilla sp.]|nr:AI-2E family transporter [Vitreoscilla sp.]